MQNPKAYIFWNAPFGQCHLSFWLKALGYTVFIPEFSASAQPSPGDIAFVEVGISLSPPLPPGVFCIYLGESDTQSPFVLKLPMAPRILAHLLKHLDTPQKITPYIPGIPEALVDIIPWLKNLDLHNADIHLPELFHYIDDSKADAAILPVLTDKMQGLLKTLPELLLLGLEQGGQHTRTLCARTASTLVLKEALPLLLSLLEKNPDPEESEALIRALATFDDPKARKKLHQEALGLDTLRSLAAIESLGQKAKSDDIALLSRLIDHPEAIRAVDAASALAITGSPEAYAVLATHLYPEDAQVRRVVTSLLVEGKEKTLFPLIQRLPKVSTRERVIGCLILGSISLPQAIDSLCEQLGHPNANVRFSACEALGKIVSEKTFFPLIAALTDPSQDVVCTAITGLNCQHPETGAQAVRQSIAVHPHRHSTLVAAIAAMQATDLFLYLSPDQDLARNIVQAAAQSRNRRLLQRFLEASGQIRDPNAREDFQTLLKRAIEEIPADRPRILVVDDSPTMRRFYETLLPQYGYTVETARDGLSALTRLQSDPAKFALVLTDLNMPKKNGIELTLCLRKDVGTKIPVLMVSMENTGRLEKIARNAGINAFLRKPFTTEALVKILASLLPPSPNT